MIIHQGNYYLSPEESSQLFHRSIFSDVEALEQRDRYLESIRQTISTTRDSKGNLCVTSSALNEAAILETLSQSESVESCSWTFKFDRSSLIDWSLSLGSSECSQPQDQSTSLVA